MFADPNGELLNLLTRIADAMNTKGAWWLDWIKTLASFILGMIATFLGLWLQGRSSDRREQGKMRRVVYSELAQCFVLLDSMVRNAPPRRGVRYEMMKDLCAFDGEAYIKEKPAVFYELPEGIVLTWIYHHFHSVSAGGTYGLVEMKGSLGFFSEKFQENPTLRNNFRRFAQAADFRTIEKAVKLYKWSATIEDMIDSGLLSVVPRPAAGVQSQPTINSDGDTTPT